MKKIAFAVSCIAALVLPVTVAAHPGHGEHGGYTITHYFTEPNHAFVSIGILAVTFFIVLYTQKRKAHIKK